MRSAVAVGLGGVRTRASMNPLEAQLLRETVGEAAPRLCLRTRTRVDAGRWWRRTPAWLCVMADALVVLSVARRRYVARVPLAECRDSYYCHARGELVIAPVETLRFDRFRMSPREAVGMLRLLKTEH